MGRSEFLAQMAQTGRQGTYDVFHICRIERNENTIEKRAEQEALNIFQ